MKNLLPYPPLHLFPPPDPEGRKCVEMPKNASQASFYRKNTMGPTRAFLQNHSPHPGSVRLPIVNNQHSTNPAPAVPAVDDFLNAPPVGPSIRGKSFATPRHDCRSLSFRVSHVNCVRGVAFISFPAAPLCCTPHAPFRPHCTLGGLVHRRPHGSSHRAHCVRLSGGTIC